MMKKGTRADLIMVGISALVAAASIVGVAISLTGYLQDSATMAAIGFWMVTGAVTAWTTMVSLMFLAFRVRRNRERAAQAGQTTDGSQPDLAGEEGPEYEEHGGRPSQ